MLDKLKRINLVEFMSRCWQVEFQREGPRYVALSPFRSETKKSFYVQEESDGHWVYFDHGSGRGGTIIDAVMEYEHHTDIAKAIGRARLLAEQTGLFAEGIGESAEICGTLDLEQLLQKLVHHDCAPVRDYLLGRGLAPSLIDALLKRRLVVLNRLDESDYCCFVVRDAAGYLHGLFNRKIAGPSPRERFLLGKQYPFCLDWSRLSQVSCLHLCESIIDGLSLMTLKPSAYVISLPGAHYDINRLEFVPNQVQLVEAFDADEAGRNASHRLKERFCGYKIDRFDLQGCHDVNELLCSKQQTECISGQTKLKVKDRLDIALSKEPSRIVGQQYGVHHSRICNIRNEATEILTTEWESRRPGRKASPALSAEEERLRRELDELKGRCDLLTMRNEWLEVELKQSEKRIEDAARQGKARKKKHRRGKRTRGNN